MKLALILLLVICLLSGCIYLSPATQTTEDWAQISTSPTVTTALTEHTQPAEVTQPTESTQAAAPNIPPTIAANPPSDDAFVRVLDYIPDAIIDLKYATTDNFTGQVIYTFHGVYLRYGTVKKLITVQEALKSQGYCLKIWDAFRPVRAQQALWDAFPDPNYVSDPATGSSSHCRGNTVDITLVGADGRELEMPTNFDDFTALADRDYSDCTSQAAANAKLLEDAMYANGFRGYRKEWWHFTDLVDYEIEKDFEPAQ